MNLLKILIYSTDIYKRYVNQIIPGLGESATAAKQSMLPAYLWQYGGG